MHCVKLQMRLNSSAVYCARPLLKARDVLLGLRQLHAPDYKAEADRYRKSTRQVNTGSGCEIGPEKVSYVINEWVDKMPSNRSNQSMKSAAPSRYNFIVFATDPARGLSLSR